MKMLKLAPAIAALVLSSNANAALVSYNYSASIPFAISSTAYQSFGNTTINGEFTIDTDSVLPIGSTWGVEGTTVAQSLIVNVSNGLSTTVDTNWYVKDFTDDLWLVSTRGDAFISGGSLSAYSGSTPEPFDSGSVLFGSISFMIPKSLGSTGNLLSTGIGDNSGIYGQINLFTDTDAGGIGISLRDVSVNAVPVPAAVWLFGSGLIGLIGIARRKKA